MRSRTTPLYLPEREVVDHVCNISGVDRDKAKTLLKSNYGDLERTVASLLNYHSSNLPNWSLNNVFEFDDCKLAVVSEHFKDTDMDDLTECFDKIAVDPTRSTASSASRGSIPEKKEEEVKKEPKKPRVYTDCIETADEREGPVSYDKAKYRKLCSITGLKRTSKQAMYQHLLDEIDKEHRKESDEPNCTICMCELFTYRDYNGDPKRYSDSIETDVGIMSNCTDHFFHISCLIMQMSSGNGDCLKCPNCSKYYGTFTGDMPAGTMKVTFYNKGSMPCAGYERYGTHQIDYHFSSGKKKDGTHYSGTSRTAFLPDCPEGKEVLALLRKAFDRKLTFTVGTSVTTGQSNTVVWAGIHHKTSTSGGAWGFPDKTYLSRVKEELAAKGVK